jgi:hypothetical protein
MRNRIPLLLALAAGLAAAPPDGGALLHVAVWPGTQQLALDGLSARIDGGPAPVVSVRGKDGGLMVLVVMDVTEEMSLVDVARDAVISSLEKLPAGARVGVLRAQDGLHVLLDPTPDRDAVGAAVRALPVSGRAGLLDTIEQASRIGDRILARADVRVAVVYITDSNVRNYREDFTNPVINSSDSHDMSRRFPEGLVREKVSKLESKMAGYQAPAFIVHLDYRTDQLNEAYQTGLMQLASATGGSASFCRSRAEIPDAIGTTFEAVAAHQSVVVRIPGKAGARAVQVQLGYNGRPLNARSRFVLGK